MYDGALVSHHMGIVVNSDGCLMNRAKREGGFTKTGCGGYSSRAAVVESRFASQFGVYDEFGISLDNPAVVDVLPPIITRQKGNSDDLRRGKRYSLGLNQYIMLDRNKVELIKGYTYAGKFIFPNTDHSNRGRLVGYSAIRCSNRLEML